MAVQAGLRATQIGKKQAGRQAGRQSVRHHPRGQPRITDDRPGSDRCRAPVKPWRGTFRQGTYLYLIPIFRHGRAYSAALGHDCLHIKDDAVVFAAVEICLLLIDQLAAAAAADI